MTIVYQLREFGRDGRFASEGFVAPGDEVALNLVLDVSYAALLELWRGTHLVARIDRRHLTEWTGRAMAER